MQKSSETVKAITDFLFVGKPENQLTVYNLIIFLGNDDIEGNADAIQFLWNTGHITRNSKVILSGKVGLLNQGKEPEANRLFAEVVSRGLPEHIFLLETEATNALENFRYSKPIAESIQPLNDFNRILCIGRAFMSRRALMCAAACGYPTEKTDYYGTVDTKGKNISADSWWKSDVAIKRVLEELKRIAEYSLKGDLSLE